MRMKRKISELPDAGPIAGDELLEIVQHGQNRKALASALGGGAGVAEWGGIGGDIRNQTDLMSLLDSMIGDIGTALDALNGEVV